MLLHSSSCLQQSVLVMQAKAVAEQLIQFDIKKVYISPFYRYFLCRHNMLMPAVLLRHQKKVLLKTSGTTSYQQRIWLKLSHHTILVLSHTGILADSKFKSQSSLHGHGLRSNHSKEGLQIKAALCLRSQHHVTMLFQLACFCQTPVWQDSHCMQYHLFPCRLPWLVLKM